MARGGATPGEGERNREEIQVLIRRLRPGDEVTVTTNSMWDETRPRTMTVRKVALEEMPEDGEEYLRVYAKGPQQGMEDGWYVLMAEKPVGPNEKGNHPAPEVYHRSPDLEREPRETTKGAILNLTVSA